MKRHTNLWPQLLEFENLLSAWKKARRGKADRPGVSGFALDLEQNLFTLQEELTLHRYQPGEYRLFTIYDRKPRIIAAAPFRDRVVHHALMQVVEPLLDKRLIHDCYACRKGKGVHAAVDRYQGWSQRYRYTLKLDIRKYFPSIDHQILKAKLRRYLKDPDVLWLFERIIDSAPESPLPPELFPGDDLVSLMDRRRGLPIGNLTSQFLGNLYLNELDHYIQQNLQTSAYLRYVDDMIILADDKRHLWTLRDAIDEYLAGERLRLHPCKAHVFPVSDGVDVLGYRVFPFRRRMRKDAGYRFRRRLKARAHEYAAGRIALADVHCSIAAWLGHARHADSEGLQRAILAKVYFVRGTGPGLDRSCVSRRWLEQQSGEPAVGEPQQEHR